MFALGSVQLREEFPMPMLFYNKNDIANDWMQAYSKRATYTTETIQTVDHAFKHDMVATIVNVLEKNKFPCSTVPSEMFSFLDFLKVMDYNPSIHDKFVIDNKLIPMVFNQCVQGVVKTFKLAIDARFELPTEADPDKNIVLCMYTEQPLNPGVYDRFVGTATPGDGESIKTFFDRIDSLFGETLNNLNVVNANFDRIHMPPPAPRVMRAVTPTSGNETGQELIDDINQLLTEMPTLDMEMVSDDNIYQVSVDEILQLFTDVPHVVEGVESDDQNSSDDIYQLLVNTPPPTVEEASTDSTHDDLFEGLDEIFMNME